MTVSTAWLARLYYVAAAVQLAVLFGLSCCGSTGAPPALVGANVVGAWVAATAVNAAAYLSSRRRGPALVTIWFLALSVLCGGIVCAVALDASSGGRGHLAVLVLAALVLLWPLAGRRWNHAPMLSLLPMPRIGLVSAFAGAVLGAAIVDHPALLECAVASVLGLTAAEQVRNGLVGRGPFGGEPRHPWVAALLFLALPLAAHAEASPALSRGPYLQRLTQRSVTVVWRTDAAAACSLAIRADGRPPRTVQGPSGTSCVLEVDGLEPATTYHYKPQADGVGLGGEASFRTDGARGTFAFLVFGDSGCGCPTQFAVRDQMLASPADFLVHTGDMVYRKVLRPEDFDRVVFEPYRSLMSRLVLWPCLGNHDRARDDGTIWREVFVTPANNREGAEDYYSFDYGNAHVVVLDSNAPMGRKSPQRRFLDRDLAASAAPWKFVVLHHPLYSSGAHGGTTRIRRSLVPLLDQHRVAAVFSGHDHDYERTKPLRGGVVVPPDAGTVYVTTGGGGKSIRPVGGSDVTAFAESSFHFTRVTVADDTVTLEMVRHDGQVRDRVVLPRRTP